MNKIFDTGDGRKLALFENKNNICMSIVSGDYSGRPVLLSTDYEKSLTSCILGNKLYYAYITINNHIKVKSIDDSQTKWEFDEAAENLFLTVYEQALVLFYTKPEEALNDMAADEETIDLSDTISYTPVHHVLLGEPTIGCTAMLMNLYETVNLPKPYADYCIKTQIDRRVNDATLQIKKDYLFSITADLEEKYAEKQKLIKQGFEEKLAATEATLAQQHKEVIAGKEVQAKQREAALTTEYEKKIKELNTTIDSIKLQYNQLMDTAKRYKEDAGKWHELYITSSRP